MAEALREKVGKLRAEEAAVARIVAEKKDAYEEAKGALSAVQNRIADMNAEIARESAG